MRQSLAVLTAAIALCAAPVLAQEPAYDTALFSSCLDRVSAEKGALSSCIGTASDACMAQQGGQSTMGMVECMRDETRDWDMLLNAWYSKARERASASDQAHGGQDDWPEATAPVLQQAQRNWIVFRDETCRYEALRYQGGSMGGITHAACMMRLTAEQALRLRSLAEDQN